ncbi:undecaprenyl/decaprenyl-phosphate alpha-N-acetylglucosaminyl 1-phosphate transferase [Candidatus Woesebacteria bacterium]|nr:undecaprenyl/decaprenyl-phosphate alpha-N-acetylglucosaminyl 1-phosphate transferase [Candidatus Woesebacteria bacterium]
MVLVFLLSFFTAAVTAPIVIYWYRSRNWIDDPSTNVHAKVVHTRAVPRGGGIVILAGLLVGAIAFLHWDQYLLAILAGAILITIVGWLDDVFDLHPALRLISGSIAAFFVIMAGIGIGYVTNPFGPGVIHLDGVQMQYWFLGQPRSIWVLADLFAWFFILWNMNIVNWSKGVDGQLPAFVTISFLFVSLLAGRFAGDPTSFGTQQLAMIAAGSFAGLLLWNWYPQKMMPGYGAGSLAGYLLSVLAILSGAKVATILMVLAIPTADAVFAISRRLYRKKLPFWGDRGHLHHKLLDVYGWSKQMIALFYAGTSLILGVLSLYLHTQLKLVAVVIAALLVVGLQVEAKRRSSRKNTRS